MIWIFNRSDRITLICSNDLPEALPILEATMQEVLNGDINLEFEVPLDHSKAILIEEGFSAAVQRENGTYELFIISEIKQIKGQESTLLVSCRHAIQELKDEIIEDYFADRKDASVVLPALLTGTRWTVGTVQNTAQHDLTVKNESALEALTTFIDRWNGEVSYSFTISSLGITERKINFWQMLGQDAGRRFEWNNDILEIERTVNEEDIKTALIGIGGTDEAPIYFTNTVWTTPTNPTAKPAGQKFVEDTAAKAKWGRLNADGTTRRNRIGFYKVASEVTDPALILDETWAALQTMTVPRVVYKMKVLDLAKVEGKLYKLVNLGDTVGAIDDDLKLQIKARCLEIKHNLLEPEETELIIDNFHDVFTAGAQDPSLRLDQLESAINDKLDRGETIQTDWLEDEINLLGEVILAGGGTVTIGDNDGILIEEDPVNKLGGALRLLGGTLALADTYDFGLGTYNWRAFGTGEGFLSDLLTTGKLTFNNAAGGTLTLGGTNNANGVLEVLNPDGGKIVTLDGEQGGFDKLSIGELTETKNIVRKWFTDGVVTDNDTYYVDPVNGDDENDGRTTTTAFKTIQKAVNSLPEYFSEYLYINVVGEGITWTEGEILIAGLIGGGTLRIVLGRNNTLKGEFTVIGCYTEIYICTLTSGETTTAAVGTERAEVINQNKEGQVGHIYAFKTKCLYLYDIIVNGNDLCYYGAYGNQSGLRTRHCEIYNVSYACLCSGYLANMDVNDTSGYSPRGIYALESTIVGGGGRAPAGSSFNISAIKGAVVQATWTHDMGAETPIYAPVKTSTWTANDTQSLFGTNWTLTDYIYTGQRNTAEVAWYGFAFFANADFSVLKNADQTNRPIQKVRILVQRYNGYGDNTARKPRIYHSSKTTPTGTAGTITGNHLSATSYKWGENKWIDLPVSFGQAFQAGTAKSIVFYNGNDLANYMRFERKMTLEITHG